MFFNEEDSVDISMILSKDYKYYAHLDKDNNFKRETLEEHTLLCKKYFLKINNSKRIDIVFNRFLSLYSENITEEGKKLFFKLIINTIIFHDIGKINPFFQSAKMKSNEYRDDRYSFLKSRHSIISSVIYLDYFYNDICKLVSSDKSILVPLYVINAYLISKHHGNLTELVEFLNKFDEGEECEKIIDVLKDKRIYTRFSIKSGNVRNICRYVKNILLGKEEEIAIYRYSYSRLLSSLLLACDYYATSEFLSNVEVNDFGDIDSINDIYTIYKETDLYKGIIEYKHKSYNKKKIVDDINDLRCEMFLDSENKIKKSKKNIFFLEAPTGSGKSNVALNLSFKLIEDNRGLQKLYYIYPYNTLVEQNINSIKNIFNNHDEVLDKVVVVNSLNSIKIRELSQEDDEDIEYEKALLDRQFLNYPIILSTHVSLFNTMFDSKKESIFPFYQLVNSVIVLDEIQSYKNLIWAEIVKFLNAFSKILNIKIIIMSATLPDLNLFIKDKGVIDKLIVDREKYFNNKLFRDRVVPNYDLLDIEDTVEELYKHVVKNSIDKKVLIEFISKKSAYDFYDLLLEKNEINSDIELLTGDDNSIERNRIINKIASSKSLILVATQVVEAGIDIDMDIGYKDISKLDSEEQFMGRINRNSLKEGKVYFFNLDNANNIYKNDVRLAKDLLLVNNSIQEILSKKAFNNYYEKVISLIKSNYNEKLNEYNLEDFFLKDVGYLNYINIEKRMKLIEDDDRNINVFLERNIITNEGVIYGEKVWKEYLDLLKNNKLSYAKKLVMLSEVKKKMNLFIYEVPRNNNFTYSDLIGDLYYIDDGERYFNNNKFDRDAFIKGIGDFI